MQNHAVPGFAPDWRGLSKYFWTSVPQCCGASKHIQQAIPRCGPEEINYVEARCPHPAPVATFAHLT